MLKAAIIAILTTAVVAAHAVIFDVVSVGTYSLREGGYTTSETVVYQNTPSALTTMDWDATYVGNGAQGTIKYTGANGTVTLSFTSGDFVVNGSTSALAGIWTFVSGTGDYANYVSGTGTFGATYSVGGTYSSTTLSGDLEPVPEPATLTALGLGALAVARRRRHR